MSEKAGSGSETPRVAVVGTGYWGKNLVRNFHGLGALQALCEAEEELLAEFAANYPGARPFKSFHELLGDTSIDAVAIATPAETHARLVEDALLAGKDVFVEKPLCLSLEKGRGLVDLAAREGRILMVGHLLWYHPAITKLKQLVAQGELGRIQYVYSNRLNLGKIRREENILWSFAPHDISVLLGLVEEMPESVHAQGGYYLHEEIADVTVSLLHFPSGVRAHIFVSWLHPYKEQKLVVVGDKKMAVFDDVEEHNKLTLYPHTIEWKGRVPVPNKADAVPVPFEWEEPLRAECQHFIDCVRDRSRPRTDGEEGLRVLQVLQRCQASLEGRTGAAWIPAPREEKPGFFAHESAFIDDDVEIGEGTKIWHVSHVMRGSTIGKKCNIGQNVVIGPNVTIGEGVKIQNNVCVYEGVTLEDYVFCGPSMVFTNVFNPRSEIPRKHEYLKTLVKRGATLGANCTVLCGTTIGRYALVGAGAVVTRDVPDYALVYGVPARRLGWVCECGEKLAREGENWKCTCGREYEEAGEALRPT